jgi:thiol:disulfide interchange protein DsbD
MRAMLASLVLLISGACLAQSFTAVDRSLPGSTAAQDFLPVEQAYQLDVEILDEHSVRLYWQIAPDYYLYQHRFAFNLHDDKGNIPWKYMPAGSRSDEYFGEVEVLPRADIDTQRTPTGHFRNLAGQARGSLLPARKQYYEVDFSRHCDRSNHPKSRRQPTRAGSARRGALLYMLVWPLWVAPFST